MQDLDSGSLFSFLDFSLASLCPGFDFDVCFAARRACFRVSPRACGSWLVLPPRDQLEFDHVNASPDLGATPGAFVEGSKRSPAHRENTVKIEIIDGDVLELGHKCRLQKDTKHQQRIQSLGSRWDHPEISENREGGKYALSGQVTKMIQVGRGAEDGDGQALALLRDAVERGLVGGEKLGDGEVDMKGGKHRGFESLSPCLGCARDDAKSKER